MHEPSFVKYVKLRILMAILKSGCHAAHRELLGGAVRARASPSVEGRRAELESHSCRAYSRAKAT